MERYLFRMAAVMCLLAVGFLTVTPFFPKADANCNYYPESMCESAVEYFVKKLNYAIRICPGSNDAQITACEKATQSAYNAKVWAEWVCEHADS